MYAATRVSMDKLPVQWEHHNMLRDITGNTVAMYVAYHG